MSFSNSTVKQMRETYQATADDLDRIAAVCAEYGFCLVKGVFTPEEMTAIEKI